MTYAQFKKLVKASGWSIPYLRSEKAPPGNDLLELMDSIGLNKYERFVLRFEREAS
jgi:hypothetical protein